MNRQEFMTKLEELLAGIPEDEKQEALSYYTGYFEDAGAENEEKILKELESPQKVAATIRADLAGGEGTREKKAAAEDNVVDTYTKEAQTDDSTAENSFAGADKTMSGQDNNTLRNILIITAIVLTAPFWFCGIAAAASLLFSFFCILLGIVAAGIGCLIGGCVVVGLGIASIAGGFTGLGLCGVGGGLLLIAFSLVCIVLIVLFAGKLIPWMIGILSKIFQSLFHKNKEGKKA